MEVEKAVESQNLTSKQLHPVVAVIGTVFIFFAGQILGSAIITLLLTLFGWDSSQIVQWLNAGVTGQFVFMAASQLTTLGLLMVFLHFRHIRLSAIGFVRPKLRDLGYAFSGALVYFPAIMIITALIAKLIPSINLAQKQELAFGTTSSPQELVFIALALVLLPPFIEEALFRGFLYTGLRTKLSVLTAVILTSLLFAAPHLQIGSGNPLLWAAFIDTFILSVVLVILRERTGSLWAPIGLHFIKNGLAFTALFLLKIS